MSDTPRDVVIVLLTQVVLRWLREPEQNVGEMADRFLSLLDQAGYEVVKKRGPQ